MNIKLNIDGQEKTFKAGFISARMLRNTMKMYNEIEKIDLTSPEGLDVIVDFEVDVYGKQFTRDQLYDGIGASELLDKITADMQLIMGQMNAKVENVASKN